MKRVVLLLMLCLLTSLTFGQDHSKSYPINGFPVLKGPYLGQTPPGKTAKQFASGIISTDLHDDASPAFNPKLDEIYVRIVYKLEGIYRGRIFVSTEKTNGWSVPQIDVLSNHDFYGGVHISKDGRRKYVTVNNATNEQFNMDIAVSTKKGNSWGPLRILSNLNSQFNEGSVFESQGYLYWFTESKRNDASPKIYRSAIYDGLYISREEVLDFPKGALLTAINEKEGYALMSIRTQNAGHDLFVSFKSKNGKWLTPVNMGSSVNSKSTEKAASISPDGKYIFFVSSRPENLNPKRLWDHPLFEETEKIWKADIYWVDSAIIEDLRLKT